MPLPTKLVTQTKQLLLSVGNATRTGVTRSVPDLSKLPKQQAGGALRTLGNASLKQFGNVATQAGRINYETIRSASIGGSFTAKAVNVNVDAVIEPVVGRAMGLVVEERFDDAALAFVASIQRIAQDVFRETMATNAYDDSQAIGYQRIASPNACAFCALVALNEYTSFAEDGGYHDNCGCTTIPIFRGLGSFRPSYYDQFDAEYITAIDDPASGTTAESILSAWRANSDRR